MDANARLLEARLHRFVSERLEPGLYRDERPAAVAAWEVPDEPVTFDVAVAAEYTPFPVGSRWGQPWGTTWFHVTGNVPRSWETVTGCSPELVVDLGFIDAEPGFQAEALAYAPSGRIIKAIEARNGFVPVGTGAVDLYLEAASNPTFLERRDFRPSPLGVRSARTAEPMYPLARCSMALLDTEVWALMADIRALTSLATELDERSTRRAVIWAALEDMLRVMDPFDIGGSASSGREALAPALAAPASGKSHRSHAVAHAHIDSAWLWPRRETIRKCARTFSNVLALMDAEPDWVFACSQIQQYAWVKDHYPQLYERIKQRVDEGRWYPAGGMWVEPDANLSGGESLVRQFLTGHTFLSAEFGVEPKEVWLPDSFGYSAALPQIIAGVGKTSLLTQKLSWSEVNRMPHHTFWWEGIDGTRIFTHFPPVDTYNAEISASELALAERQYAEKGRGFSSLMPYGYGDGGGGPTREMLASAHRFANCEGSPKVVLSTPDAFFAEAKAEPVELAVWSGEMYLELHRGTYTSQHRTKLGNRRNEHLLRTAELWATTAAVRTGYVYPADEFDRLWKVLLFNQFHDILPGSSIAWVHSDAEADHAEVTAAAERIVAAALRAVAGEGDMPLVANAAPTPQLGVAPLAIGSAPVVGSAPACVESDRGWDIETPMLRTTFTEEGLVSALVDRRSGVDAVPPGDALGRLNLHRDIPNRYDAWDIDASYREWKADATSTGRASVTSQDGVTRVQSRWSVGSSSTAVLTWSIADASPGLGLTIEVDWRERQHLLKLALPIDVLARDAVSEIQFGHLARPIHQNTSWDAARFETSAQRWVHVGESGFGVAVANASTYGWDITRNPRPDGGTTTMVRATLLRAPIIPDPHCDEGEHTFEFEIVPGADISAAVSSGYRLNLPMASLRGDGPVEPLVAVDHPAVIVEAVKLAEDGSGDVVVRLFESLGGKAAGLITTSFQPVHASWTDLLERPLDKPVHLGPEGVSLSLRPFEIVTLRLGRPTS